MVRVTVVVARGACAAGAGAAEVRWSGAGVTTGTTGWGAGAVAGVAPATVCRWTTGRATGRAADGRARGTTGRGELWGAAVAPRGGVAGAR